LRSSARHNWNFSASAPLTQKGRDTTKKRWQCAGIFRCRERSEGLSIWKLNIKIMANHGGQRGISPAKTAVYDKLELGRSDVLVHFSSFPFRAVGGDRKSAGRRNCRSRGESTGRSMRAKHASLWGSGLRCARIEVIKRLDMGASGSWKPSTGISGLAELAGVVEFDGKQFAEHRYGGCEQK